MKLVVGLGNPGEQYVRTRHNVGFLVAESLARSYGTAFATAKFGADIAEAVSGPERVWIMKPRTFMNCSGEAVAPAMRFWKIALGDLVVVHDDLELDTFRVQVKVGGGHGGHNGLKSLNAHVGSADYVRVRVGVGRPPPRMDPADYVLGRFSRGEDEQLEDCVAWATEAARTVVEVGAAKAMNLVNRRKTPEP